MANDLNSAMNTLKGLLGDGAEDKIRAVMQGLSSSDSSGSNGGNSESITSQDTPLPAVSGNSGGSDDTLEYLMRVKSIVDEMSRGNDDRSRLLMSLRPYMRSNRQRSIDSALKLLALTRLSGVFKNL